jgi:hypothetical protein
MSPEDFEYLFKKLKLDQFGEFVKTVEKEPTKAKEMWDAEVDCHKKKTKEKKKRKRKK